MIRLAALRGADDKYLVVIGQVFQVPIGFWDHGVVDSHGSAFLFVWHFPVKQLLYGERSWQVYWLVVDEDIHSLVQLNIL